MSVLGNAVTNDDAAPDVGAMIGEQPNISTPPATPTMAASGFPASPDQGGPVPSPSQAGPSRLQSVLSAVANVVTTGLSGIPDRGRPSFVTGLGQGARAEQAAEATQQAIKFRNFDDQVRLANLAAQDKELQLRTQAQSDAHQAMQNQQADWDESHGISYDSHPNDGTAVTQTLQSQTATNGYSSVPGGTYHVHDGETINSPSQDPDTQAGLLKKYQELAGVIPGIPNFPGQDKAQFVPAKNLDVMTHILGGYNMAGNPYTHKELEDLIPALQSQRAAVAKNGGSPYQLQTLDNLINIYQANEKNHQDFEDQAFNHQKQLEVNAPQTPQQKATLTHSNLENTKLSQEISQNAQQNASGVDSLGVKLTPPAGGAKAVTKLQGQFKKDADSLSQTESTFDAFQDALNDINSGKDITGAKSVTTLFNAIGLSATPLKGMGMRINQNTVAEHVAARDVGQSLYSKLLKVNDGDIITPQQIKDYASIAAVARQSAYVNKVNEARSYGLDPSFLLPAGNGRHMDANTAQIYLSAANGNKDAARQAAQKKGWNF